MIAPRLGAIPHKSELTVKIARQVIKNHLRPITLANHPLIGRTTALETRYEVSTHVLCSLVAPRLPAIYGRATLAILVSSTSMKAARATTTAISQGLYLGRHCWEPVGEGGPAFGGESVRVSALSAIRSKS